MTKIYDFSYPSYNLTQFMTCLLDHYPVSDLSCNFFSGARDKPLRQVPTVAKFVKGFCCCLYLARVAGV